jgi:hypothetical protein
MSMPVRRIRTAGVRQGGRRSRRQLVWATRDIAATTLASGSTARFDLLNNLEVAGASVLGSTVMRVHGALIINWTSSDTTLGANVGVLPSTTTEIQNVSSQTDLGEDWMYLTICPPALCQETTLVGTNLAGGFRFDIRAKRRVQELNQRVFYVLQNPGSGTITHGARFRLLLALP